MYECKLATQIGRTTVTFQINKFKKKKKISRPIHVYRDCLSYSCHKDISAERGMLIL